MHNFSCRSIAQLYLTLCNPMDCSTTGFPVLHYHPGGLLKLMSIESVMPSNHLVLCCPLLLPSVFPISSVFPNDLALPISIGASASASVLSMNIEGWFLLGLTGLILTVQGTLKSLLQHSSKASVFQCLAFFMVQFSHLYMTTEKNHSFDYMDLCWQSDVSAF